MEECCQICGETLNEELRSTKRVVSTMFHQPNGSQIPGPAYCADCFERQNALASAFTGLMQDEDVYVDDYKDPDDGLYIVDGHHRFSFGVRPAVAEVVKGRR